MNFHEISNILSHMQQPLPASAEPFLSEEDGTPYRVWKLIYPDQILILKEAKGSELELYSRFFRTANPFAPRLVQSGRFREKDYLLMEYIPGEDLCICTREKLIRVLNSLISMQDAHWTSSFPSDYKISLSRRKNRGKYLNDTLLEGIFEQFIEDYSSVPRTLCHDDLLPFNIRISQDRAVFIDWEAGGILPYPVSLARLIAHGEEGPDAFFHMSREDKLFAVEFYYQNFIRFKGIEKMEYLRSMKLFLFYEYCEWIYLGNKYPDADMVRFQKYREKAYKLAEII